MRQGAADVTEAIERLGEGPVNTLVRCSLFPISSVLSLFEAISLKRC